MDDNNALKRRQEVLVVLVYAVAVSASQVVEVWDALKNEINQSQNDCYTERISPDAHNCDDICPVSMSEVGKKILSALATRDEPSEEGEH